MESTLHKSVRSTFSRFSPLLILLVGCLQPAVAASYHVDADTGGDAADGLSPATAWKTLERVNEHVFSPGDRLLFKAGTRLVGQLAPKGSGGLEAANPAPVIVSSYGDGPRPRIDAEGRYLDALLLRNTEFWEVENLEITNLGAERKPFQTGVRIVADGFGRMRHIRMRHLFVHDVNGDLRKSKEGCGIFFETKGGNNSRFEDLVIENCHLVRTDRNGICQRSGAGARSLGVVIRGNLLEDIGGDCIKPWGSNGALVERNIVRGGRTRCDDYAAGIWPWDCDDTVIQFNEVSGVKGIKDGQAFDSDYRCRRSLFQFNYSHDNEGGFFLICSPGNSYNEGTVIRYNISQNDGINNARVFHFAGGARNTRIYNNIVYLDPKQDLPLILCTEWDRGSASDTVFANNIFWVDGRATYQWGRSTNMLFEHNVFFGRHENPPSDAHGTTNAPPLVAPGTGGVGFQTLSGYRWKTGVLPLRGKTMPNHGIRDFFGNRVPDNPPPCLGVEEMDR